jgi:hypothetical protein
VQPVPLFVELCAGTAAVSLRLHDADRKPPISRTGGKAGFADATLRVLGMAPGQRALRYVWAEPDASARLLLASYVQPGLWPAAAEVLAGWAHEPPRELWQALRAEGEPTAHTPRELARYVLSEGWHDRGMYRGPGASKLGTVAVTLPGLVKRLQVQHAALAAEVHDDAHSVPVQGGAVVYLDPPYAGTMGYAHELSRAQVVQLALRWAAAGSTVAVAEAEPLPELLAAGWHAQELTWARTGQARTYSAQKREFITCNVRPRHPGRPTRPVLPALAANRGRRVL